MTGHREPAEEPLPRVVLHAAVSRDGYLAEVGDGQVSEPGAGTVRVRHRVVP